jgi:hypothetical protein
VGVGGGKMAEEEEEEENQRSIFDRFDDNQEKRKTK